MAALLKFPSFSSSRTDTNMHRNLYLHMYYRYLQYRWVTPDQCYSGLHIGIFAHGLFTWLPTYIQYMITIDIDMILINLKISFISAFINHLCTQFSLKTITFYASHCLLQKQPFCKVGFNLI